MDEGNGIHQLEHELTNMFRLQRALTVADCLVEIAARAKLQDKVDMRFSLEGPDQVDDVGMGTQAAVQNKLLRLLVDGKVDAGTVGGRPLSQALDGDGLAILEVPSQEDHAEGAMVERSDSLITAIKKNTSAEVFPQAGHCEGAIESEDVEQATIVTQNVEAK
jgi:hypothetical protein